MQEADRIAAAPLELGDSFLLSLAGISPAAQNFPKEAFCSVTPLIGFTTEGEAIQLANDTEFGLAADFYSRNVGRIFRIAEAIEGDMASIYDGLISREAVPFGGVRSCSIGHEGLAASTGLNAPPVSYALIAN